MINEAAVKGKLVMDEPALATAAYAGERVELRGMKSQCLHPDKPIMFACGDCPRRGGKAATAAEAEFDGSEIATAVFLGECTSQAAKKSQCLHPDKPIMFAC